MKFIRLAASIIGFTAIAFAAPGQGHDDRLAHIKGYKKWRQATKDAVLMDRAVAAMCRSFTPAELVNLASKINMNPHSLSYFRVFINPMGWQAFSSNKAVFPVGTVIVKEKLNSAAATRDDLLTVMVKRQKGWRASSGDWEFFIVDSAGKLANTSDTHCISCHRSKAEMGWVYRTYLTH